MTAFVFNVATFTDSSLELTYRISSNKHPPSNKRPFLFELAIRLVQNTPLIVYVQARDGRNQDTPASCCTIKFRQNLSLFINFQIIASL